MNRCNRLAKSSLKNLGSIKRTSVLLLILMIVVTNFSLVSSYYTTMSSPPSSHPFQSFYIPQSTTILTMFTFLLGLPRCSSFWTTRADTTKYDIKHQQCELIFPFSSANAWRFSNLHAKTQKRRHIALFKASQGADEESNVSHQEEDDDDEMFFHSNGEKKIPPNRLIKISSRIELPFSAEIAYDAYSNLPRQATWSSWLESVVISKTNPSESVWTMKFLGLKYSWTAIAVTNERPHIIQWKSTSGLQNFGTVRFYPINKPNEQPTTLMTMKMTFVAPPSVAILFNQSTTLAKFVEKKMITQSLEGFRDVVLKVDLKDKNHQKLQT